MGVGFEVGQGLVAVGGGVVGSWDGVVLVKFSTQENLLLYALALADRLYRSAEKIQRGDVTGRSGGSSADESISLGA